MTAARAPINVCSAPASLRVGDGIGALRQAIRALERTVPADDAGKLALGIPAIDAALGGGLPGGSLHEIAAAREAQTAAATGFALALAARTAARVLWIAEDLALAESGAPYGPGLDQDGLAPERLITVTAARAHEVLWAMEEALRCRAVSLVIGELRARTIDPVATRRLALAAAAGNTLGLLLRPAPDDAPSSAATRWIIAAAPSSSSFFPGSGEPDSRRQSGERSIQIPGSPPTRIARNAGCVITSLPVLRSGPLPEGREKWGGIGPPRLAARLVRNRRGHLGTWIVEWDSVEQRFVLAAHPQPVADAACDRSHPAVA
jgi:protein ImuA